ncbi:TetR/AcrR family transcriptional regulator [Nocardia miyunensis]|uniref:TetR/AcrR family transcriptional regulator n=1 Tax=Nocardia miyunensis TaxID=282684 RepID=UPI001471F374|nr:TetR/AcrR family transcriptional regulator [Nocardia miyunensis]
MAAFHRRRKQDSHARIVDAATENFCDRGYLTVSVEDIAASAGVSRMTFYRHFRGKADLAAFLFKTAAATAMPVYASITTVDYTQRRDVTDWITTIFEADRKESRLLKVFVQASVDDGDFTPRAQQFIRDLISRLGTAIPAFAVDPDKPGERRRWLEAWLLLYEILDQSNHAALASGVAGDPLMIEILADRFLGFVEAG